MIILQNSYCSFLLERKSLLFLVGSFFICVLLFVLSLTTGSEYISFFEIIELLRGKSSTKVYFIIKELRMPRTLLALLAGGSLGVSGTIVQPLVKNPLASPDLLGINTGGTLGALAYLFLFQAYFSYSFLPFFTALGSFLSLSILLFFMRKQAKTLGLVLIGLTINTIFGAVITASLLFSNEFSSSSLYVWTIGSTYGSSWTQVIIIANLLLILGIVCLFLGNLLDIHDLSDDLVILFGHNLISERKVLLCIASFFSATAVSCIGPVGFVGLIAPHCAKKMIATNYNFILPLSFFIGASITLIADLLGRTLHPPYEFPLGVFTTLVGAPYFLFILFMVFKYGQGK